MWRCCGLKSESRSRVKESGWLNELRADVGLKSKDEHAVRMHFKQHSSHVRLVRGTKEALQGRIGVWAGPLRWCKQSCMLLSNVFIYMGGTQGQSASGPPHLQYHQRVH